MRPGRAGSSPGRGSSAADGGARHAGPLGLAIDRWVGDGDSLGEAGIAELEAAGVPVERARPDKDESDTELAVLAALAMGATALTVLGALGGPRVDHALANVGLLSMPELEHLGVRLARGRRPRPAAAAPRPPMAGRRRSIWAVASATSSRCCRSGPTPRASRPTAWPTPAGRAAARGPDARPLEHPANAPTPAVVLRRGQLLVVETPATL